MDARSVALELWLAVAARLHGALTYTPVVLIPFDRRGELMKSVAFAVVLAL